MLAKRDAVVGFTGAEGSDSVLPYRSEGLLQTFLRIVMS